MVPDVVILHSDEPLNRRACYGTDHFILQGLRNVTGILLF